MPSTNNHETFFPNIRKHLLDPTPGPPMQVTCFCCTEDLDIRGIPPSTHSGPGKREPARVLRCGHVVGLECYREWALTLFRTAAAGATISGNPPVPVACPTCKAAMWCLHCGHLFAETVVPGEASTLHVDDVPLLEAERRGGATARDQACDQCHMRITLASAAWMTMREIPFWKRAFGHEIYDEDARFLLDEGSLRFILDHDSDPRQFAAPTKEQRPWLIADVEVSSGPMPEAMRKGLTAATAEMARASLVPAVYIPMWNARDDGWARKNRLNALWDSCRKPVGAGTAMRAVPGVVAETHSRFAGESRVQRRVERMWYEMGGFIRPKDVVGRAPAGGRIVECGGRREYIFKWMDDVATASAGWGP